MANIVITRTQQGYINIDLGSYYPGSTLEEWHCFPYSEWAGLCGLKVGSETGIEFHIKHESSSLNLSYTSGLTSFMQVDSVGGVTPTSDSNLRELILNLVQ